MSAAVSRRAAPCRTPRAGALVLSVVVGLLAGCSSDGGTAVDLTPTAGASSAGVAAGDPDASAQLATRPAQPTPSDTASPVPGASEPDGAELALAQPGAEASVGGVVEGFPSDVIAPYPGAEVLLTSAAASTAADGRLDVALAGRTGDAPEAVLDFYRRSLAAAGFVELPSPGGPGLVSATFTRGAGAEVLSVAVSAGAAGEPRQFTVGGTTLAPEG